MDGTREWNDITRDNGRVSDALPNPDCNNLMDEKLRRKMIRHAAMFYIACVVWPVITWVVHYG
jgi:hypothetical protein